MGGTSWAGDDREKEAVLQLSKRRTSEHFFSKEGQGKGFSAM